MTCQLEFDGKTYVADLLDPKDISIPLREGLDTVNCFFAPPMETSPVVAGDFVGSTKLGGNLNFLNVKLNPHGNGTHTECVGHISKESFTINQTLSRFHFVARLVSVYPERLPNGDKVVTLSRLQEACGEGPLPDALVIRTLPNDDLKLYTNYSGANPTYVDAQAMDWLVEAGVDHLLIDLPSVDREQDGGALAAHKAFWTMSDRPRTSATISELIYVNNSIRDGLYLLNIQIAAFEIDASPSKPVLYPLSQTESS